MSKFLRFLLPEMSIKIEYKHQSTEAEFNSHCKPNTTKTIVGCKRISQCQPDKPHASKVDKRRFQRITSTNTDAYKPR